MYFFVLLILFSLILKSKHLLSLLISLEFLGLMIFFLFSLAFLKMGEGLNVLIALMVAMGCESVMGLVLFVSMVRLYSKDYFMSVGGSSF